MDPDHFKRLMPEWPGYTAQSERAGNFCHRESGYLQEIAQEVRASSLPLNYCRSLLPLTTAAYYCPRRYCPPATASLYYCPSPLLRPLNSAAPHLLQVAMQNSQNVWVDGSLRDGPWFEKVFREVRKRFPHYQIAIFEVG